MEARDKLMTAMLGVQLLAIVVLAMNVFNKPEPPVSVTPQDVIDAYNRGQKDALRTNGASWALEQACLTLWASSQPIPED